MTGNEGNDGNDDDDDDGINHEDIAFYNRLIDELVETYYWTMGDIVSLGYIRLEPSRMSTEVGEVIALSTILVVMLLCVGYIEGMGRGRRLRVPLSNRRWMSI